MTWALYCVLLCVRLCIGNWEKHSAYLLPVSVISQWLVEESNPKQSTQSVHLHHIKTGEIYLILIFISLKNFAFCESFARLHRTCHIPWILMRFVHAQEVLLAMCLQTWSKILLSSLCSSYNFLLYFKLQIPGTLQNQKEISKCFQAESIYKKCGIF